MADFASDEAAGKLRAALDMFGVGLSIMRQNLRRRFPEAADAEIERKVEEWLRHRPGAENGDAPGRVRRRQR